MAAANQLGSTIQKWRDRLAARNTESLNAKVLHAYDELIWKQDFMAELDWSAYEGRLDYPCSVGITLTKAFAECVTTATGFDAYELPEIFAAPADEGENDAARDLTLMQAEALVTAVANARIRTFARPLGGGEIRPMPAAHWEIDDPLPRMATGLVNADQWHDPNASPTHRIFVDRDDLDKHLMQRAAGRRSVDADLDRMLDPDAAARRRIAARSHVADEPEGGAAPDNAVPRNPYDRRIIGLKDVEMLTNLKKSTIYARMAEGRFPQQVDLDVRKAAWFEHEIQDWIDRRGTPQR